LPLVTRRLEAAQAWVLEARARVKKIAATVEEAQRKRHGDKEGPPPKTRVAFLEWVEPLYVHTERDSMACMCQYGW
jgi:hypothetical protein